MRHRTFRTFKWISIPTVAIVMILQWVYNYLNYASFVDWTIERQDLFAKVWNAFISREGAVITTGVSLVLILTIVVIERRYEERTRKWRENRAKVLERRIQKQRPIVPPPQEPTAKALVSPAPAESEKQQSKARPNLVALEPRIGYTEPTESYLIREVAYQKQSGTALTAFADFSNEVVDGLEVASLRSVMARITYYDERGAVYWRSSAGWWIDNEYNTISFEPHQIRKLIIVADLEGAAGYTVFANHHDNYQDGNDKMESRTLKGDKFRAEVELTAGGKMVGRFNYNLLLRPVFGIKLIRQDNKPDDKAARLETARKLDELLEEGQTLLKVVAHAPDRSSVDWWEAIVKAAIAEELGELEEKEFAKNTGLKLYPYPAQHRQLVDRLFTLTERLGEIISQLRRG